MIRAGVFVAALMMAAFAATAARAACNALALCTCTATTTGVNFGGYSALASAPNDSVGSVTVTCILTVAFSGTFTVDLGAGSSGSFTARQMRSGASRLTYNLYTTAARTDVWGDGTGGSQRMIGAVSPLLTSVQTLSVYGRTPAAQNVPAGAYADNVIVTVTY